MKVKSESEVAQSCLTLRDPMDCSLPGSSVHGIFQARVLEWVVIAFSDTRSYCFSNSIGLIPPRLDLLSKFPEKMLSSSYSPIFRAKSFLFELTLDALN